MESTLNTKSQWVGKAISRKIFVWFTAEWMLTSQNSSVPPCDCQSAVKQTNKQTSKQNKKPNRQTKRPNQTNNQQGLGGWGVGGGECLLLLFKRPNVLELFLTCLSTWLCEPETTVNPVFPHLYFSITLSCFRFLIWTGSLQKKKAQFQF